MKLSSLIHLNIFPIVGFIAVVFLSGSLATEAWPGRKIEAEYDIIYITTKDLERVLDYKDELETIFTSKVKKKIKIVARGDEYALIYDGNDSVRTVAKTLIEHAILLNNAGFDEPYATKEKNFHSLYNVSYGIGPNLQPLKKRYKLLYTLLGPEVKKDLFIEKTDYGNYILVYRRRGNKSSTVRVARQHAKVLRRQKISSSITKENNNTIVYGESSLIDEAVTDKTPPIKDSVAADSIARSVKMPVRVKIRRIPKTKKPGVQEYTKFEQQIESYIKNLRKRGKIYRDESTAWMVFDLVRNRSIVDINADKEFQAASMIKPFIALAFFHLVKEGRFKYGPKSRREMGAMIQRSSNSATNWVMRQVGGPAKCEAILRKYYGHIFKKTEIREYIPSGGRTYRNSASPADYVRYLRALWNKEIPYYKEMRRLMALPGRDRLYHGTPIPRGTLIYNKTGSTAHLCGDMGILVPKTKKGKRYPYIVVGIIERRSRSANYGRWMDSRSRIIRQISTLVYKKIKKEHHLR